MGKFRNKKTAYNGEIFDSKAEYGRYQELELLEKAGKIKNLNRQTVFEIVPKQKGERAATYKVDFTYEVNGVKVAEDVKGCQTEAYKLKRKLFKLNHPDWRFSEIYKGRSTKYSTFRW